MDEIIRYYERSSEAGRLTTGSGLLERERTRELIGRKLTAPPARVLDIGGGPGGYASWLTGLGYQVHLLDPVAKHVDAASRLGLAGVVAGDARALPWPAGFGDAALLLGPLYHLVNRSDRLAALAEARRVVRPGGWVFISAISRWASLFHSLVDGFVDDHAFGPVLDRDLREGLHINDTALERYFTTAALHRPRELQTELEEAGFVGVEVCGVEGPGWLARDFDLRWEDGAKRRRLLELVRATEADAEIQGASLHLLGSGKVPPSSADEIEGAL